MVLILAANVPSGAEQDRRKLARVAINRAISAGYDNSMAESLNGIYKTELVKPEGPWKTRDQLEYATFEWVDWYNTRRLHEQIGMIPPAEKEAIYYASNDSQNQPVLT